jgi:hypothetical protein
MDEEHLAPHELPPLVDPLQEIKRLLVEVQQSLARADARRKQERGEDGFDG